MEENNTNSNKSNGEAGHYQSSSSGAAVRVSPTTLENQVPTKTTAAPSTNASLGPGGLGSKALSTFEQDMLAKGAAKKARPNRSPLGSGAPSSFDQDTKTTAAPSTSASTSDRGLGSKALSTFERDMLAKGAAKKGRPNRNALGAGEQDMKTTAAPTTNASLSPGGLGSNALSTFEQDMLAKGAAKKGRPNRSTPSNFEQDMVEKRLAKEGHRSAAGVGGLGSKALSTFEQDMLAKGAAKKGRPNRNALGEGAPSSFEQDMKIKAAPSPSAYTSARGLGSKELSKFELDMLAKGVAKKTPSHMSTANVNSTLSNLEEEMIAKGGARNEGPPNAAYAARELSTLESLVAEKTNARSTPGNALANLEGEILSKGAARPNTTEDIIKMEMETLNFGPAPLDPPAKPGAYSQGFAANGILSDPLAGTSYQHPERAVLLDEEQPQAAQADHEGLTVAQPVNDSSELPTAIPDEPGEGYEKVRQEKKRALRIQAGLLLLFGLVVVIVVAIVVPFVLLRNDSDATVAANTTNATNENSTEAPKWTPEEEALLQSILPNSTLEFIMKDKDIRSPQARAYRWTLEDPVLKSGKTSWRVKQRFALATLYYATDGDNWANNTHWLEYDKHECHWFAEDSYKEATAELDDYNAMEPLYPNPCELPPSASEEIAEDDKQEYAHLWLRANNLVGTVPPELFFLTSLRSMALRDNALLTGSIPTEIGMLTRMEAITFSFTQVSGNLPSEIGALSAGLDSLHFIEAQLSGSVPSEIGLLSQLHDLFLDGNNLDGTLPTELGNLTNLVWLYLHANQFTGSFLEWATGLPKLEHLILYENLLSGSIPTEIGLVENLEYLFLWSNQITGSIPSEVGLLTNLFWLYIDDNMMTSSIPTELGNLVNAGSFWTNGNSLKGPIPSELGRCTSMYSLSLAASSLTGTIPTELGQLPATWSLIPTDIGLISPRKMELVLSANQLTGPIPSEMGQRESLNYLYLDSNQLTGFIPSELAASISLEVLHLESNQLSSVIPPELGNLVNLTEYNVANNSLLSGAVPGALCGIDVLVFDCTDLLCGCNCICAAPSGAATTQP